MITVNPYYRYPENTGAPVSLPGDAHPADDELDAEFQAWDMLSDEAWAMVENATDADFEDILDA